MPKVSIIIPVYNAAEALPKCIESVLAQEYRDFELFLMDDGSADDSPRICDEYAAADARVKVVHKTNSGVSDTRNQALDLAQGDYIQFIDADDWISPDATKLMVRGMEENSCDMVIADFYRVVEDHAARKGFIDADHAITREEYADYMLENPANYYYGVIWNKMFKRELIERNHLRMDPELTWCEDFIFNMEYVLHSSRIFPLRVPIYYYVKTEGSLVSQGMNPVSIMRMKLNVIAYYRNFYQRVYDEQTYQARIVDVHRFLVDWADDDAAIPLMPKTKKLGEERVPVYASYNMEENVTTALYYGNKLYERLLESVADMNDLELNDVKVFASIKYAGTAASLKEISDFTRLPMSAVANSLRKLLFKRLIAIETDSIITALDAFYDGAPRESDVKLIGLQIGKKAGQLIEQIKQARADYDAIRFDGLGESEINSYLGIRAKVMDNIKSRLF